MTDEPKLPVPTAFVEIGAPLWQLPPITTPAGIKKIIVDAVAPLMPDLKARVLLDVNAQKVHVQLSGQRPTFEEVRDHMERQIARVFSGKWPFDEDNCPGHVAWDQNPKVCGRCGVHIDSLRPD